MKPQLLLFLLAFPFSVSSELGMNQSTPEEALKTYFDCLDKENHECLSIVYPYERRGKSGSLIAKKFKIEDKIIANKSFPTGWYHLHGHLKYRIGDVALYISWSDRERQRDASFIFRLHENKWHIFSDEYKNND